MYDFELDKITRIFSESDSGFWFSSPPGLISDQAVGMFDGDYLFVKNYGQEDVEANTLVAFAIREIYDRMVDIESATVSPNRKSKSY